MTTETIAPTTPLSPKDILQKMRSLGLASWVLKDDISALLKTTEEVTDGVQIYLGSLDEKDHAPTVEQASMIIESHVGQKEVAAVYCAILRFAASRVTSSQASSGEGVSGPAGKKRPRRKKGQTQTAGDNASSTSGEAGSSSGKKSTRTHYPDKLKQQVLDALESGMTLDKAVEKFKVNPNTAISWIRKRKAAKAVAGNGKQGGTSSSDSQ